MTILRFSSILKNYSRLFTDIQSHYVKYFCPVIINISLPANFLAETPTYEWLQASYINNNSTVPTFRY